MASTCSGSKAPTQHHIVAPAKTLLGPFSGELLRFLLDGVGLAIEPVVRLLGDRVDTVLVAIVDGVGMGLSPEWIREGHVPVPEARQSTGPSEARSVLAVAVQ